MYKLLSILAILMLVAVVQAQTAKEVRSTPGEIMIESVLCTGIENRMPVGEGDSFPADVDRVYLWTKVTGVSEGETTIHHVWLREGEEMADVELTVKGSPWRTYSYKTIPPEWSGKWEVKITGPDGNVIKDVKFIVGETNPAEPAKETDK
jgi:hypothetical protein